MRKALIGLAVGLLAMATVGVASAGHSNAPECAMTIAHSPEAYGVTFTLDGRGYGHMVRVDGLGVQPHQADGHPLTFYFPYTEADARTQHDYTGRIHNADGTDRCFTAGRFFVKGG